MPMNYMKTAMLLAALTRFSVALGGLSAANGRGHRLRGGGEARRLASWNSDTMVLRMYGAHEVDERSAEYFQFVRDLAQRAGLPMPRVYVMDSAQPNAFATGRSPSPATRGGVSLVSTMLQALSPRS